MTIVSNSQPEGNSALVANVPSVGIKTQEQELGKSSRFETVESYPVSDLKLEDRLIDDFRPLRVAVIGAGLSGILSGILLPEKVPNVQLTIFEKSKEVVSREHPEERLTLLCLETVEFLLIFSLRAMLLTL